MAIGSDPKTPLQVIIGSLTIKAYVACPKEFEVIGIVRCEMEYGFLAISTAGYYVRVNGSIVEALCKQKVESAISSAKLRGRGRSYANQRQIEEKRVPTVIFRKRRQAVFL